MTKSASHPSSRRRSDADPVIDALLCEFVSCDPPRRQTPPDLTASILEKLDAGLPETQPAEIDDSDPLIDSLLAEFVPDEASRRSTPPDLSTAILHRLSGTAGASEEAGDHDPVIDALLPEFVPSAPRRRSKPPNLTGEIVTRLSQPATASSQTASGVSLDAAGPSKRRLLAVVLAAAAAVWGVTSYFDLQRGQNGSDGWTSNNDSVAEAMSRSGSATIADPETGTPDPEYLAQPLRGGPGGTPTPEPDKPLQGIPLESPSIAMEPSAGSGSTSGTSTDPTRPLQRVSIERVAAISSVTAETYWRSLGLTPTPEAPSDVILDRLRDRLGVSLPVASLSNPQRLEALLSDDENAEQIAARWLALTSGNNLGSIRQAENQALLGELRKGVSGEAPMDTTLVSLIDGTNSLSTQWYETIGRKGSEGIAKHLASLSINADVRCVRCHDSHIGRAGTQDDYWSFVALVRNVVKRKDARWVISEEREQTPTFFELLDGRQRMAEPKVSGYLSELDQPIDDFESWTQTLVGSDALADSLVDSLWKLVHGRSLKPSPVDAFAPPYDGSLDELHGLLADDLKASRFDVARTLALIISSPMAKRSVPEPLRDAAALTASDRERSDALELVSAFAGSVQPPRSGIEQRIDVAMRRIGERLQTGDQGTLLAQPLTTDPRNPGTRPRRSTQSVISLEQKLSVDFPADDASLPVGWLKNIEDFDRQVQHLVYLSGRESVPPEITDAAKRLKAAGSAEAALSRIWWILRN